MVSSTIIRGRLGLGIDLLTTEIKGIFYIPFKGVSKYAMKKIRSAFDL